MSLGVSKWLKAFRNTIVVRKYMYLIPNWKKKIHRTLFCEIMNKKLRKTIFFFKKYTSVSKSANPKAPWKMVVKNFFLCQNILHKLCSGVGGFVGPSLSSKKKFCNIFSEVLKFWAKKRQSGNILLFFTYKFISF